MLSLAVAAQANEPVKPKWINTPTKELVEKACAITKQAPIKYLKTDMDAQADNAILDMREPNEYEVTQIPGSINVPRDCSNSASGQSFPI